MTIERRALTAEYRALGEGSNKGKTFEAVVMAYEVADGYGTIWTPGTFTETLGARMPRIAWAHDWADPLGRWVDADDGPKVMRLKGEFDDFDAVPKARQASAQLQSGTIDQFSVGFERKEWVKRDDLTDKDRAAGGTERMTKADLPEVSLVLMGAVPGTSLIGVRMASGLTVPEDFVIDLGRKMASKEITHAEAVAALELVAGVAETTDPPTDDPTDAHDDAAAVLDELGY